MHWRGPMESWDVGVVTDVHYYDGAEFRVEGRERAQGVRCQGLFCGGGEAAAGLHWRESAGGETSLYGIWLGLWAGEAGLAEAPPCQDVLHL